MDLMDIKVLNTGVEALLNRRLSPLGLTYAQGTLLGLLARADGREVAQKDLEEGLGLSRPTVNSIVSRLLDKQLVTVEKSSGDRRRNRVGITEQGRSRAEEVSRIAGEIRGDIVDGLSAADETRLESLIQHLTANVQRLRAD